VGGQHRPVPLGIGQGAGERARRNGQAESELEALRAKMIAEQEKVAAAAHISANLIKLVMADVGA
jgi:hypothetical protein